MFLFVNNRYKQNENGLIDIEIPGNKALELGIPYIETSAMDEINIDNLLHWCYFELWYQTQFPQCVSFQSNIIKQKKNNKPK